MNVFLCECVLIDVCVCPHLDWALGVVFIFKDPIYRPRNTLGLLADFPKFKNLLKLSQTDQYIYTHGVLYAHANFPK